MIGYQFCRKGFPRYVGTAHIKPLLETYYLLVTFKQPKFLASTPDMRKQRLQNGSYNRDIEYTLVLK